MKSKVIIDYFNYKYPFEAAEDWDKVGLRFGTRETLVKKVIVTLDLTNDVFQTAIKNNVQLIITHHPLIFNDDKEKDIKESPYKKKIINYLSNNNIGVLTLHTNYDKVDKRMATIIANYLGIRPIASLSLYGHLFSTKITKQNLEMLLNKKMHLKIKETNLKDCNKIYQKWGLLPGAGAPEEIIKLHQQGAEFIITSDVKWSTWITAFHNNIKIIEISHIVEDVFTFDITQQIIKKWNNIKVIKKNILNLN